MALEALVFPLMLKGINPREDDTFSIPAPVTTIEYTLTGGLGTPSAIPFELEISTSTTSAIAVSAPLLELVEAATAHVRAMAFLPGDEKADEIVDRLMARARPVERKRPLSRS